MRGPRVVMNGGTYHIGAKTTRNEFSFEDADMKDLYQEVLYRAKDKYGFELISFIIMGNHIHLMIKTRGKTGISRIMQYIQGLFAMLYNKIHKLSGPFWRGRFWSILIIGYYQYLATFLYIANNPVRAGLVNHPLEYVHSGLTMIVKKIHRLVDSPPKPILIEAWKRLFFEYSL